MQKWYLKMKDGFILTITCKEAEITRNGFDEITNIHWSGIIDNIPIKLDLTDCDAIWYESIKSESCETK